MIVQIEVLQYGHVIDHQVVDDVRVGVVTGEEDLFCDQPTPDFVAALDHCHPYPSLGKVGRRHQPVGAAADDNDVPIAFTGKLIKCAASQQRLLVLG
ncbi:hypothetical protein ES703_21136 [subsurface metagenome]